MKAVHSNISLDELCRLFGKTRQAYHKSTANAETRQEKHGHILAFVKEQRKDLPRVGTEKLQYMLASQAGILIGRDALYSLLRANKLLVKKHRKRGPKLTDGDGNSIWPDLRKEMGPVERANEFWCSDITYMSLREGRRHCYATFVVDEYSHLIVGFTVAQDMSAQATLEALKMAVAAQGAPLDYKFSFGLVFHSDRGSQFKSGLFQGFLDSHQIRPSMTQDGKASDNPVSERLNGIIKNELLLTDTFDNFEHAVEMVTRAVHIYNTRRPHRSCNMLTPQQAHEKGSGPLKKLWKQRKKKPKAAKVLKA